MELKEIKSKAEQYCLDKFGAKTGNKPVLDGFMAGYESKGTEEIENINLSKFLTNNINLNRNLDLRQASEMLLKGKRREAIHALIQHALKYSEG